MNGIASKSSEAKTNNIRSTRPAESVETAGSLAMNKFHSLFATNVYDMFTTDNPFAVDYSQYAESGETVAYAGGFLSNFSNAVSTLSSTTSSFNSTDCGASFSSGTSASTGSCGGFTSFC